MRTYPRLALENSLTIEGALLIMLRDTFKAPLLRVWELSSTERAVGAVGALLVFVSGDFWVFFGASLAFCTSFIDWRFGKVAARALDTYDANTARWGLYSKMSGLVIIGIMYAFELAISGVILDTHRYGTLTLALWLVLDDLGSLAKHRKTFGGSGIPVLSSMLSGFRRILKAFAPGTEDKDESL